MSCRSGGGSGTGDRDRRAGNVPLEERHVELEHRGRPAQAETLGERRVQLAHLARLRSADEDPRRPARMQVRVPSGAGLDRQVEPTAPRTVVRIALRGEERSRRVQDDQRQAERPRLVGQRLRILGW